MPNDIENDYIIFLTEDELLQISHMNLGTAIVDDEDYSTW